MNSLRPTIWQKGGKEREGEGKMCVSLVFEILRSICLWGYKWKCPIGHCVSGSMVQKRHLLGDTDVNIIRVLVIDNAAFTVT